MQPIRRSQLVAVNIPLNTAAGAKFFLPDIPELRDAIVDGIEAYGATELLTAPDGTGVNGLIWVGGVYGLGVGSGGDGGFFGGDGFDGGAPGGGGGGAGATGAAGGDGHDGQVVIGWPYP